jgi:pimeloyl-ACP methyl ester carboxylesterase
MRYQLSTWATRGGTIASYSAPPHESEHRPVVLMLHGAMRSSEVLAPWGDRLSDVCDIVLMDLPGHGRSTSLRALSIQNMAEAIGEAISQSLSNRRVLIVGESLGGTVALAIGGAASGPVAAVFAADPPMTTAKLWNAGSALRPRMGASAEPTLADRLGRDAFGLIPGGCEELIYYPVVGALAVPAVIATGDVPLHPPRRSQGVPCMFDAVDRFVIETFYPGKAQLRQIANCGHVVLSDAPEACRDIIVTMLADISPRAPGERPASS